jgi:hypothetical protein
MWYVFMFSGLAILCVVVVLIRNARSKAGEDIASPSSPDHHHHTDTEQDRARRERKRRRAQSKADRRKRH